MVAATPTASSTPIDRAALVFLARLTEQAERYDEMLAHTTKLATAFDDEFTVEERNLWAVACKNVVGAKRAAWRVVSSIEDKTTDPEDAKRTAQFRETIEQEIIVICNQVVEVTEKTLLPQTTSDEGRVFLIKTLGDYYRYLGEVQVGAAREATVKKSEDAYVRAMTLAMAEMTPTHPIRLGLALNFSVFYYEMANSPDRACQLAKQAFDDAIAELDTLTEDSYKDSTLVMQLLRDNLTLWTMDNDESSQ
jgi:hypothetical protein